jgi:hypothetical protein
MEIDWNQYQVVAFIDSNVALECNALDQLPWREIHSTGPILILVTPTVLKEVDSKKNNARLGDHARRFNRTLRPLLAGSNTVVIRERPAPTVDIALAECGRTFWEQYPRLDPEEPDSKVIAQALTSIGPSRENMVVLSQDIRPLDLARQHGLRVHHIGDNWLRPKEKSEAEKRANNLQREIDALKGRQPKLTLSFKQSTEVVRVYRVSDLTETERRGVQDTIIRLNPMPEQHGNYPAFVAGTYDHSLGDRYERWAGQVIPQFVREYERKLELNFGQVEIVFRVENVGQVPAESLLIRLSATGGWLNERYVLASPSGPRPPAVRNALQPYLYDNLPSLQGLRQPGKHEFVVLGSPQRSIDIQLACADFRHGYDHEYRFIAWVDPRAEAFTVEAVATASNLHGEIRSSSSISKEVTECTVFDLIDNETMRLRHITEVARLLEEAIRTDDYSDFEFDGSGWDK